jgi:hypothetical protein
VNRYFSDIIISLLVLLAVSVVCVLTLLEPGVQKKSESVMSAFEVSSIAPSVLDSEGSLEFSRRPSSVNSEEVTSQVIQASFLCDEKSTQEKVQHKSGKLMMMNFKMCAKNAVSISLKNHSNGFKAQIFKVGKENYKTDFIQLSKGSNHLKLEIILKDGQKLEDSLVILTGS